MIEQRDNYYVVTGCSGGGKSAIIEALKARGFLCADEAGRMIVREQVRIGGNGTPWQDPIKFRELLLSRYIYLFEQITETSVASVLRSRHTGGDCSFAVVERSRSRTS